MRKPSRIAGFTLLELLIALAILAILVGVGAPSMREFLASSRLTAASTSYYDAFRFAREEAARLNRVVALCPDNGSGACGNDWKNGITLVGSDQPRRWPKINATIDLWINNKTAAQAAAENYLSSISFNPDGSNDLSGSHSMKFCDPKAGAGSPGRVVVFNSAGFLTMAVANSTTAGVYRSCNN